MDNQELREMYANLLVSSMNNVVKDRVHPGYVEIIKQLCHDKAKILRHIAERKKIPTISVYYCKSSGGNIRVLKDFSDAGYLTSSEKPEDICKYLSNLMRCLMRYTAKNYKIHFCLSEDGMRYCGQ